MKVVIIEDEIPASKLLSNILLSINPFVEIVRIITNVSDAVTYLKEHNDFDILFLDVELSDGSSFEIFSQIEEFAKPIIVTTAYQNYAISAFAINSIAYVLKPISKNSILEAFEKIKHYRSLFNQSEMNIWPQSEHEKSQGEKIIIRLGNRIIPIRQEDISAFYSKDKSTFISTIDEKHYPLNYSLDDLEKKMNRLLYFRINRKILLSRNQIKKVHVLKKSKLQIETEQIFPVPTNISSEKSSKFKDWFIGN